MWIYNFGLFLYACIVRLAALRHRKAKLWVEGRRDLFRRLAEAVGPGERIVWVHVASLGEFEQGRPIIERLRREHPEYKILVTFFSPSGYEIRKNYPGADYIFYLPIDTPKNARRFLDIVRPEIAVFVKYEFWLNLLGGLRRRGVRTYIVSAIFRPDSIFFRPYGGLWRQALESFDVMFVQNEESKRLLAGLGFDNVVVAGDTRFDRVAEIAAAAREVPLVERFRGDGRLFVAGSTWGPDEELLVRLMNDWPDVRFVVAPHEMDEGRIRRLMNATQGGAVRYTRCTEETDFTHCRLLVLDTVGLLSSVYGYASWSYIRRFRRRHPQHAGGRHVWPAGGVRSELPQVQGGARPGDARRRMLRDRLRAAGAVVRPPLPRRGAAAQDQPHRQGLHATPAGSVGRDRPHDLRIQVTALSS